MKTAILLQMSLLLSVMTVVHAGEGYPEYSWDHVPLYAHVGIGDGLEPDQYNFLADHFKLITFTGGILTRGSVETNIAAGARAIKQRNPKAKVLFYWSGNAPKPQWKLSKATFPKGGYLPLRSKGKTGYRSFDVSRQDVRDWWSDVAAKAVRDYSCDGIFVDGAIAGVPQGPWDRLFGKEKAAVLDAAMVTMMAEAHKKMGPDKLIIFNTLHVNVGENLLPVTDGAMIDDFDRAANLPQQRKKQGSKDTKYFFTGQNRYDRFIQSQNTGF
ncbi:MAG: putative glycoside hydrolase family 15 protein [Phycisphaerae bacterium]|nr:putative glycoside hydrolase family 15 protein [Phycisphaerae bacterium]